SVTGIASPTNGRITSTATSAYGRPANEPISSDVSFGQPSGTYSPPSRARPASVTSRKSSGGASPRVDTQRTELPTIGLASCCAKPSKLLILRYFPAFAGSRRIFSHYSAGLTRQE